MSRAIRREAPFVLVAICSLIAGVICIVRRTLRIVLAAAGLVVVVAAMGFSRSVIGVPFLGDVLAG